MGIRGNKWMYGACGILALAGLLHAFHNLMPAPGKAISFTLSFAIYTGVIITWGISVYRRLLPSASRRYPVISALLMVLWIVIRAFRYRLVPDGHPMNTVSWYAYYIPQILLPLMFFFSALSVRMRETYAPARAWRLLYIPAVLLIVGVLTNDTHELAFRFLSDSVRGAEKYEYSWLYYTVVAWNVGLFLHGVAVISVKVRHSPARQRLWQVLIWLVIYVSYLLLLAGVSLLPATRPLRLPYEYPEISCMMMIAVWESCIRTHLIPSNSEYPYFFSRASVSAQITDDAGHAVYRAEDAPVLTTAQMASAESAPVFLDRDTRLSSRAIRGGRVYWTDDLSDLNRRNDELTALTGTLSEETDLLAAENKLKQKKAHIRERTEIYESVATAVRPQLETLQELLSGLHARAPDANRILSEACVYGAYLKRRSNLVLLSADTDVIPAGELALCLRESLTYLRLCGVECSLSDALEGILSARDALLIYDFFEWAIERTLAGLRLMLVRLGSDGGLHARLMLESGEDVVITPWDDERLPLMGARCLCQEEDGAILLTLRFPGGGAAS